ncbi:MAG: hypothetical protein J6B01_03310 [Ruminococcus sp.]|nr:hypothetical protein [Ruminococcus sp.]
MEEKTTLPTNENSALTVSKKSLEIFKTEADLTGRDIAQMSNFFDGYIEQMSLSLREQSDFELLSEIPISDLSIVNEIVQKARVLFKGNVTLIPDFDNLPLDVKKKLKQGLYSIGDSKQVDGNMRAVILDENGTRVKDITLKKVISNPNNMETARSIGNQMQMKQIYTKLAAIEEFQTYQIERDRDQQIIVPFLDARSLILRASNAKTADEQKLLLEQANSKITSAIHSLYTDMDTSAKALARKADSWLPDFTGRMNDYMRFLVNDLQIATKYIGVSTQILEYIGDNTGAKNALLEYQQAVLDFLEKPISKKGLSAALVMHENYPYSSDNLDQWYFFKNEVAPNLKTSMDNIRLGLTSAEPQQIYIVSVEDAQNEKS